MKRFLALLLGITMLSGHFVIPVYATDSTEESVQEQESIMTENLNLESSETEFIEETDVETEEESYVEKDQVIETADILDTAETIIFDESFDKKEEELLAESETEETEEEKEVFELDTFVYINPTYNDLFTEIDILSETWDSQSVSFLEDVEYLTTEQEVIQKLRTGMEYRRDVITINFITTEAFSQTVFEYLIESALAETGIPTQGDYMRLNYRGATIPQGEGSGYIMNGQYYYSLNFHMLYYTTYEQEEAVTVEVNNVLADLNLQSQTTNYLKIKSIYDWVCENVTYDDDNLNDPDYLLKFSTYAALINKTSVCQGYSSLMYRLLREAGISTRCIVGTSSGVGHAWNIVKIGDYYYNIDSTWDAGAADYSYFLKCNDNFADHTRKADYTTDAFHAAYPMASSDFVLDTIIKAEDITLEYEEHEFAAVALQPEVTVSKNSQTLTKDVDYIVAYYSNYDAGQARVVIKGIGDYSGEITKYFTITKHILAKSEISLEFDSTEYTGSAIKPKVTIKYNGKVLVNNSNNWAGITYQKNINIGTAEVVIEPEKVNSNFETAVIFYEFQIVPIDLSSARVTLENTSYLYAGEQIKPGVSEVYISSKKDYLTETDYTIEYGENFNKGTGYVYIVGKNNYQGTATAEFTIKPVSIYASDGYVTRKVDDSMCVYNGEPQIPEYDLIYNGKTLVEGVDYTVQEITDNINAGSVRLDFTGIGNFYNPNYGSYYISQSPMTAATITLEKELYKYTGEPITPVPIVTVGDRVLIEGEEYTYFFLKNEDVGTATLSVRGKGNYDPNSIITKEFKIVESFSIEDAVITMNESYTYTGLPIVPDVSVTFDGQELEENVDYKVECSSNTSVGTAAVTITGLGDYVGTVEKSFEIIGKLIEDEDVTLEYTSHTVTGRDLHPGVTVVVDGETLVKDTDYTVSYEKCRYITDIPKVTITGIGNWSGIVEKTFTITQVPIDKIEFSFDKEAYEYTGNYIYPKVTLKYENITTIISAGSDHDFVEYSNNINVSTENSRASLWFNPNELNSNFESGGIVLYYDIVGKNIDKNTTVKLSGTSFYYNGNPIQPSVTSVVRGSSTLVENKDYVVRYEDNVDVGTGYVCIDGIGIYSGTIKREFTISKAPVYNSTIVIDNSKCVYNGKEQVPVYTLSYNDKVLVENVDFTVSLDNNVNAGTGKITFVGIGNFQSNTSKNFAISQASIENAEVTFEQESYLYTGNPVTPEITVAVDGRMLVKDTDYTLEYRNNINAGRPYVVINGINNYTGALDEFFTIEKADQNIKVSVENTKIEARETTKITASGIGTISYESSDASIATVDSKGVVTGVKSGNVIVMVYANGNGNYNSASESLEIEVVHTKHDYDEGVVTAEPGCETVGKKLYTCEVCGATKTETIKATGHAYSSKWTVDKAATCKEAGSESRHCTNKNCDAKADVRPIAKAAHDYDEGVVTAEPGCETAGKKLYTCEACGATKTETIKATGHAYSSKWTVDKAATCKEAGSESRHCTNKNCDAKADVHPIAKAAHDYDEGVVTAEPGCETAGKKLYTCEVCGATKTETIKATGHAYSSKWTVDKAATCKEAGSESRHCTNKNCDAKADVRPIAKAAHDYDEGVVTAEPGCETAGKKLYTCEACGETKTETIKATGHQIENGKCKLCGKIFETEVKVKAMYRLYNPNSGEHFYTANKAEKDYLDEIGWNYEGIGWYAPETGNPVYRLYNPNAGDHHYTLSAAEKDHLVSVGWNYEGIGWYSDVKKSVPLYRLYNPNAIAGSHHYTVNYSEAMYLKEVGWHYEGIGWYGVTNK